MILSHLLILREGCVEILYGMALPVNARRPISNKPGISPALVGDQQFQPAGLLSRVNECRVAASLQGSFLGSRLLDSATRRDSQCRAWSRGRRVGVVRGVVTWVCVCARGGCYKYVSP